MSGSLRPRPLGLWINRNLRTFENKQTSPPEIPSRAISLLREWETAQPTSSDRSRPLPPQLLTQISSPSTIICNTDAAWNKDTKDSGLAWIFTSPTGREITRGCSHQTIVSSPLMAEALAIRAALEHAVSLNITIIWLRSDCKGLIQAIFTNQRSVELFGVLSDIESTIISSFAFFTHLLNQLTFENKQLAPIKILSKSIRLLKDWEHAQIKPPQAPNIPPPPFPNQIAASSTTVCFTDAAWNKATNEAGLAWIFTTRSGQEISRGCLYQEHVSPALMAESLAIRAALGHAASLDITIIWLRSDCKGLIQAITTNHRSVELFGVLADIESIISIAFLSFHASFLPRSQNGPADSLAKASLCNKTSVLGPSPH
ncbi:hypothetical protein F2Q68_00020817 [Brassica cretica]|uniref:RNase H type-1 domain-containing protein n=1 Tax=Brassica cretica TaxID=69181 RepID=A0A8S9FQF8_BRACR|nr:hypothetical protein F2Q68_00020817 [Brassica cretica]